MTEELKATEFDRVQGDNQSWPIDNVPSLLVLQVWYYVTELEEVGVQVRVQCKPEEFILLQLIVEW